VGTGSGIQAATAASLKRVKSVLAVDVNPEAVAACNALRMKKVRCIRSDLFSAVPKTSFDTIIFNPPYLPQDGPIRDIAVEGGRKGYEVLESFLEQAPDYLAGNGLILIVFSSLTGRDAVDAIISRNLLHHELLGQDHVTFEDLFVYRIAKTPLRRSIESRGVRELRYFAKGKRGIVFTGMLKGRKIAVKVKLPESKAVARLQNEAGYLRILNRHGIGPTLRFAGKDYLGYDFAEGEYFKDYLTTASKTQLQRVLSEVLRQCFVLDTLGINKEEMTRPWKHVIVGRAGKKLRVTMIDFERCHKALPHNVTQFMQCVRNIQPNLLEKGIVFTQEQVTEAAASYSRNPSRKKLNSILALLKQ
ncbi:methyltransferase, partial [Candidatus Woesearchaeota archaeon]|nr:methyltransferase [Candidatus Woesearchaeota archaeon]